MKLRDRKKVSTTFHGAGLVVPYDKNTEVREDVKKYCPMADIAKFRGNEIIRVRLS